MIERARRLSSSSLWSVQRRYYEQAGTTAWSSGDVPHLLTSGPLIARAYAAMLEGHLGDLVEGRFGPFSLDEPLYVIELGSGTGRLGAMLGRELERIDDHGVRIVIVLTDAVEANVAAWSSQRALTPLVERGLLDYGRYDAGDPARLELRASGKVLGPEPLANPPVLAANYFFDVLPQDLYAIDEGVLVEDHVALCAPDESLTVDDPLLFANVFLATRRVPVEARDDEFDPFLAQLVDEERLGDRRFLFPGLALRTLDAFAALGGGRTLAMIGERPGRRLALDDDELAALGVAESDAGSLRAEGALAATPGALLAMGIHGGSMSLPVDFDVLDQFATERGGSLVLPPAEPTALVVAVMSLGEPVGPSLSAAHQRELENHAPEDTYLTIKAATDRRSEASLAMLLGAIRLGGYDPYLLRQCFPMIDEGLRSAPEEIVDEAVRVLFAIDERDFPLPGDPDLALGIATLLAPAGRYVEAIEMYRRSAERTGPSALTCYNLALCHLHLEQPEVALGFIEQAVALDPSYTAAVELGAMVVAEMANRTAVSD